MTARPVLGVGLGVAPPLALLTLARAVALRLNVVDERDAPTDAPLLRRHSWADDPVARRPRRLAWWVDDPDDFGAGPVPRELRLVLSASSATLEEATARGLPVRHVPAHDPASDAAPVAPFVRERIRRARRLGTGLVIEHDDGTWTWDNRRLRTVNDTDTALSLASFAHLRTDDAILRGWGWGCPIAAPEELVIRLGGQPGVHAHGPADPAASLPDTRELARLSLAGRRHYETRHSRTAAVDALLLALDLQPRWSPSTCEAKLWELDARRGPDMDSRFAGLFDPIVPERA